MLKNITKRKPRNFTGNIGVAKYADQSFQCIVTGLFGADLHHIMRKGKYPEYADCEWNLIPLSHHLHVECHNKGMLFMSTKYFQIHEWLVAHNWVIDETTSKWVYYR